MLVLAGKRNEVWVAQHPTIISPRQPTFTKWRVPLTIIWFACGIETGLSRHAELATECRATGASMQATGELIRLLNYVDDISATLRRIHTSIPTLTGDERRRLAEYMRKADPNYIAILEVLEGGK
jgi:hypothetical protein